MKKLFTKQTEGDKLIKLIIEDIEKSPQNYQKLSGDAFLYIGKEEWWGYVQMKPGLLTIRKRNAKTKEKNLHYDVNLTVSEKFNEFYEAYQIV